MARSSPRRYPRTVRLNRVVHEVVAEQLELVEDPRVGFVTVTDVEVAADLREGTVYYTWLHAGPDGSVSTVPAGDDAAGREARAARDAALQELGARIHAELNRQLRLRYVPKLTFREDPGVQAGARVEQILRELHAHDAGGGSGDEPGPADPSGA